jgi:hypothetical protein
MNGGDTSMGRQHIKTSERKINTVVMLTSKEQEFLDRKIDKRHPDLFSRSAMLRFLVGRAMVDPAILDAARK